MSDRKKKGKSGKNPRTEENCKRLINVIVNK